MSARVRDSSTIKEIAGGSGSDSGILHCGMMAAATTMKMIAQSIRLASDTIVNRPWQGRQLFQAAYRGHIRRLNP